jgi:hypothetical protein
LDWLAYHYPDRLPRLGPKSLPETPESIWYRAGQTSLVERLRVEHRRQTEEDDPE